MPFPTSLLLPPHICHLLSPIVSLLQSYELTYRHTYFQSLAIATVLKTAGQWYVRNSLQFIHFFLHPNFSSFFLQLPSLCAGGHVYYLGVGSLGLMALLDASECPPTFGAG